MAGGWFATRTAGMTLTSASTVREMARHEQDTVRALLIEAFLLYQPHFPDGVFAPYLRELLDFTTADPVTLVAEAQGQITGTMRLYQAGAPHGVPLPDGWAMVRAAAVVPGLRRTGVARALLAECERRARRTATHLAFHTLDQLPDTFAFALRIGYPRRPDLDYRSDLPGEVRAFGRKLPAAQ